MIMCCMMMAMMMMMICNLRLRSTDVVGCCGFMVDGDIQARRLTGWNNGVFQELERIYRHQHAPRIHSASNANTRVRYSNGLMSRHHRDSLSDTADNMRRLTVKK